MHDDDGGTDWYPPTSPTGRLPQWVLDEAARSDTPPVPPARPRRRALRTALRGLVVVPLVLLLSLGAAVLVGPGPWPWAAREVQVVDAGPQTTAPERPAVTTPSDRPAPGVEAAPAPRGQPLPPPPGGGPHGFVNLQDDGVTPVGYDPCRPVHYVIRPDGSPRGGEELLHEAVDRISEVTGLQFVYNGRTTEVPTPDRPLYQPERYGNRWAPVLITWETEEENPDLAGDVVGQAGSVAASLGNGPRVYISGTVSLDAPRLAELLRGRDGRPVVRGIVLHELGHLMGLAHVDDEAQLMHPEARREVPDFAAGDLTGLAAVGSGPCVPEL